MEIAFCFLAILPNMVLAYISLHALVYPATLRHLVFSRVIQHRLVFDEQHRQIGGDDF